MKIKKIILKATLFLCIWILAISFFIGIIQNYSFDAADKNVSTYEESNYFKENYLSDKLDTLNDLYSYKGKLDSYDKNKVKFTLINYADNSREDISFNKEQKLMDMIEIVALLHTKTISFKDITLDKYKELYDNLNNNINYSFNYYEERFNQYIQKEYNTPSEFLLLRNYSIIYEAFYYCLDMLDKWYVLVKDKTKQRVSLIHNNLKLEHFIHNTDSYLISWDNYRYDTPIIDLYNLYKNEWENVSFLDVFSEYNNSFELLEEEKILFNILVSTPYIDENYINEYDECVKYRKLINYLNCSSKIIFDI